MSQVFLDALRAVLGDKGLRTGDDIPPSHYTDWSGHTPTRPLALLLPASTEEVSQALRVCHEHRIPITPQGGLTGMAGGAIPAADTVALSLSRMNVIESVDAAGATLQAQAGVTLQAAQEAAHQVGMLFGVDLGARGSCQIGGNISTNAGGMEVLQYGMMREQVLGLEVVLADGTVLSMLRPMLKNNTGYDLKHWFIGSEGTLGIVTRALLRLRPAPRSRATALLGLPDYAASLAVLGRLQRRFPGALTSFELMWADFYETSLAWMQARSAMAGKHPFYALIAVVGNDAAALADEVQEALGEAMEAGELADAVVAQSESQAAALWRVREAPAEFPTRMDPINFDVSLPLPRIGEVAQACVDEMRRRWPDMKHPMLRFGHIGDSNLHFTVNARDIPVADRDEAEHLVDDLVYGLVAKAGGSISAEHGIGTLKRPYLSASRTPAELAAMRALKEALDPLNLLNPGKILTPLA
ncbi:MAG TPA: FAD-binding oxidoreductase [Bordetella sp.]